MCIPSNAGRKGWRVSITPMGDMAVIEHDLESICKRAADAYSMLLDAYAPDLDASARMAMAMPHVVAIAQAVTLAWKAAYQQGVNAGRAETDPSMYAHHWDCNTVHRAGPEPCPAPRAN